jgi:hypothetical protein
VLCTTGWVGLSGRRRSARAAVQAAARSGRGGAQGRTWLGRWMRKSVLRAPRYATRICGDRPAHTLVSPSVRSTPGSGAHSCLACTTTVANARTGRASHARCASCAAVVATGRRSTCLGCHDDQRAVALAGEGRGLRPAADIEAHLRREATRTRFAQQHPTPRHEPGSILRGCCTSCGSIELLRCLPR